MIYTLTYLDTSSRTTALKRPSFPPKYSSSSRRTMNASASGLSRKDGGGRDACTCCSSPASSPGTKASESASSVHQAGHPESTRNASTRSVMPRPSIPTPAGSTRRSM